LGLAYELNPNWLLTIGATYQLDYRKIPENGERFKAFRLESGILFEF